MSRTDFRRQWCRLACERLEQRLAPARATLNLTPGTPSLSGVSMELQSYSFGSSFNNEASFDQLVVSRAFGDNSPNTMDALMTGGHYATGSLIQYDDADQPVAAWQLEKVYPQYSTTTGVNGAAPGQNLSFFVSAVTESTQQATTSWNVLLNTPTGPALSSGLVLAPYPAAPASPAITLKLTPANGSLPTITLPIDTYHIGYDNQPIIGAGTIAAGKVSFDSLDVEMAYGAVSPQLFQLLTTQPAYSTATLIQRTSNGNPVVVWVMSNPRIVDDTIEGGSALPRQGLAISFHGVTEATKGKTESYNQVLNQPTGPSLPAGLTLSSYPTPSGTATVTLDMTPVSGGGNPVSLPISDYTIGYSNPVAWGNGVIPPAQGNTTFDNITVTLPYAADSPRLLEFVAMGQIFSSIILTQRDGSGQPVAAWVMSTGLISSDAISGGTGLPGHEVTIVCGAVTEATSTTQKSWSILTNGATGPTLPTGLTLAPLPAPPTQPRITLELTPASGSVVTIAVDDYTIGWTADVYQPGFVGLCAFDQLEITTAMFANSPLIMAKLTQSVKYNSGLLIQRNDLNQPVVAWALSDVFVEADSYTGGVELPEQCLKFAFVSITEGTSKVTKSWNQVKNNSTGPALPGGLTLSPLPAAPSAPLITLQLIPQSGPSTLPAITLPIDSYQFGIQNPVAGIGSSTSFDALQVQFSLAANSPWLLRAVGATDHFGTAVLTQRNSAGAPVAVWVMDTVNVVSDSRAGAGDSLPGESAAMIFSSVTEATSAWQKSWSVSLNNNTGPGLPAGTTLSAYSSPPPSMVTLKLTPASGTSPVLTLPIASFSLGLRNLAEVAGGGGGAGKAERDPLTVQLPPSIDDPLLFQFLTQGSVYSNALLTQHNLAGQPVAKWSMGTVMIETRDVVNIAGELPRETLTLAFYSLTEVTNKQSASWDFVANQGSGPIIGLTQTSFTTPPTDIGLSNVRLAENLPAGALVGTLSSVDADLGDSHTYSLVAGAGDTGNGAFTIVGNELQTAVGFDFETQSSHSIRVRSTDAFGLFKNEVFTISVTDGFDGPTIVSAKVNDGAVQRSKVDHLTITFSAAVTLPPTPASAFTLIGPSGAVAVNVTQSAGNSVATLATGNLPDGKYTLTIIAAQVTDAFGQSLAANFALNFHRFFGDSDGDGTVAANDFIQFRLALGGNNPIFDFDGDGSVAASDFIQFRLRFGGSI